MRTLLVVFLAPSLDDEPRFPNRDEEPSIQAAVAEHAVERLVVPVLPRASGLDELCGDPARRDPVLDPIADELGTVVALDHTGNTTDLHQLLEDADHVVRVQEPSRLDPDRFPRELVDDRQEPKPSSIRRLVRHEVVAPDVIRVERSIDRRRALARSTPLSSLPSHLEAFPLPQQAKPVAADRRPLGPQDPMDLAVTPSRIALGELMNAANESSFLDPA